MENPLLKDWNTPFGTPPFPAIGISHFRPAIEELINQASAEIDLIISNQDPADFENSIAALDRAGEKLGDISSILFNLNSAETSKELQIVTQDISPLLTRFSNDITLNEKLFERVKYVYERKDSCGLNTEQQMLLEKHYRNFILGGAGLTQDKKTRFREISEELSKLSLKFEEHILNETNDFELHLMSPDDLAGLPEDSIEAASEEAVSRGKKGWVFTLHAPSFIPFMKYSERRDLREKMYRAYSSRAYHSNDNDNRQMVLRIVNLRLELANILGFKNFADLTLGDRMLDSVEKVRSFLHELHHASFPAARRDFDNVMDYALKNGHKGTFERWDWAFYSEKLRKAKFEIDDELLRPYFALENLEQAVLGLASTLFGIRFIRRNDIPVYNPEVKTWEVLDADDSPLAVLYIDYFPRKGKNGGAWMTSYREQRISDGKDIRPLISIVANFTRPTGTKPSLLTFEEVNTFLHEFGHSLHGIFSKCSYESLAGTNVARDFVELPSQFMENYAGEKEWLKTWARHYLTGETIPDNLIEKIRESLTYNEGYACNRQLSFGFLDMAWHTLTGEINTGVDEFERKAVASTELFPPVDGTNISVSFGHIFGGGYASGYYGYKWAEVLDADAFSYFKETGIFNRNTATSFRKNILERGGSNKPMVLYKMFRGKEPSIDALLERSGLKVS
ncbi:MAG TPA: M3 family metallopeptidase [Bacteroidales bacterium]|jgi:peptidyl-dipeptidase Dcp|nr:M3 family metallopeptidase [Bacteroidales bacterium]OQB64946.1 MAG: Peptidyl-dipeptidase dcp [Bacteroidetes bacterium ADurb.Bin145]HOU01652.1 M3 family metallopeptidase [Bacteroidales bacterium]HQG63443.1 M3 family metallopeptidase [Bacteroidales bacterium]HQK66904.1 M3 family metallopeptidase [Bacteroidales bacterium]